MATATATDETVAQALALAEDACALGKKHTELVRLAAGSAAAGPKSICSDCSTTHLKLGLSTDDFVCDGVSHQDPLAG